MVAGRIRTLGLLLVLAAVFSMTIWVICSLLCRPKTDSQDSARWRSFNEDFDPRGLFRTLQSRTAESREAQSSVEVSGGLFELSFRLRSILSSDKSITGSEQLAFEYGLKYTNAAPIFTKTNPAPGILPEREYFLLTNWSINDPPGTPLLWTYLKTDDQAVRYITISGSKGLMASNLFELLTRTAAARLYHYAPRGSVLEKPSK